MFKDLFVVDYRRRMLRWKPGVEQVVTIEVYNVVLDHFDELAQMDDTVPMSWVQSDVYGVDNGWATCSGTSHLRLVNGWTLSPPLADSPSPDTKGTT